ncbi:hypothetical protein LIER_29211 [Lithospermum erythrorhizon]|uniref:Uncharacterized protein n=1 Tax=Lithospermum erythrorhizon TaxID=34254 RepID=A0AAV3RIF2_LITER
MTVVINKGLHLLGDLVGDKDRFRMMIKCRSTTFHKISTIPIDQVFIEGVLVKDKVIPCDPHVPKNAANDLIFCWKSVEEDLPEEDFEFLWNTLFPKLVSGFLWNVLVAGRFFYFVNRVLINGVVYISSFEGVLGPEELIFLTY